MKKLTKLFYILFQNIFGNNDLICDSAKTSTVEFNKEFLN